VRATIIDAGSMSRTNLSVLFRSSRQMTSSPSQLRSPPTPPASLAPIVRLSVMSGFEVRVGTEPVFLPANVERVIALLAVRGRPQLRTTMASTLWMDTTTDRASANLRTALWRARQHTGDLLRLEGHYVALSPDVQVDLAELTLRARRLIDGHASLEPDDGDPRSLAGDLLPGWDEEWITFERERLRQLRIHALESLCAKLSAAGRAGESIDAGLAAVEAEPLRESAQRALVAAHLAEGNISEARRQFHFYRELLREALGIEPSAELRAMVDLSSSRV
jgi:DNA-binding SARP family transcriptional activator